MIDVQASSFLKRRQKVGDQSLLSTSPKQSGRGLSTNSSAPLVPKILGSGLNEPAHGSLKIVYIVYPRFAIVGQGKLCQVVHYRHRKSVT